MSQHKSAWATSQEVGEIQGHVTELKHAVRQVRKTLALIRLYIIILSFSLCGFMLGILIDR